MRRRVFIAVLLGMTLAHGIDLGACGDKFLRVGRSARFYRYAAVHPAAVLIYPPATATRAGIDELKTTLKRAGHRPVVLDRTANVAVALASSRYDVVIADYTDADRLKVDVEAAPAPPALLPILNRPTKDIETVASRTYAFLIKPHTMTKYDALAELDRLMDSRDRTTAARSK